MMPNKTIRKNSGDPDRRETRHGAIVNLVRATGVPRLIKTLFADRYLKKTAMRFPTFSPSVHDSIAGTEDYFRYATLGLAVQRVLLDNIPGAFAEVGVFRGDMTRFIHALAPDRPFFLFDTFEGFPREDLPQGTVDNRFKNTSVSDVLRTVGDTRTIIVRKGYVPDTFAGLENERFSLVLLDLDLYKPTLAGLEFMYPRLSSGGFLAVHDYNSIESDGACRRAVDEFLRDKPEKPIELADVWGTVLFRKIGRMPEGGRTAQ